MQKNVHKAERDIGHIKKYIFLHIYFLSLSLPCLHTNLWNLCFVYFFNKAFCLLLRSILFLSIVFSAYALFYVQNNNNLYEMAILDLINKMHVLLFLYEVELKGNWTSPRCWRRNLILWEISNFFTEEQYLKMGLSDYVFHFQLCSSYKI